MEINNPYGGFLIAKDSALDLAEKAGILSKNGAKVHIIDGNPILLAAWEEFEGQGLWVSSGHGAVAYDLELSNSENLKKLAGFDNSDNVDPGEILWALYNSYGPQMLDYLRGSFCFGLWDTRKEFLLTATDPYGLRPVVYTRKNEHFAAASRIRHLLWAGYSKRQLNEDSVFHYLFFHTICSPFTIYKDINKLEPGHKFVITQQAAGSSLYYDIQYRVNNSLSEQEWIQRIRDELEKAVAVYAKALPYDKTGCFLSGGTDSSSIVAYYTKLMKKPAKTFSIGFDESKYNELDYADIAVKRYQSQQKEYYVTPDDVLVLINALPSLYDEPFGNASVIPAFFCSKSAGDAGMKYLLGGDGGDEIFGGNERYVTDMVFQRYFFLPKVLRKAVVEPLLSWMPSAGLFYKAKRYVRRSNIPNPERFYSYNLLAETSPEVIFKKEFIHHIDTRSFMDTASRHYQNVSYAEETNRLLYLDMKFTITDNDIRKVTQMVEAAGLRVRYPYLDRDLVDFTTTIPADIKVKWGKNRYIFKKAMNGILPDEIIHKTKHGMGLPIDPWFKKNVKLKEFLADHIFSENAAINTYINQEFMQSIYKLHKESETSYYGDNLWVFLILELWLRKNL
ncbi:asparagine synthase-related protein [uncultured Desulfobacter sp.]|uniref:asparagine synthetase B family protein n=1 Tax=uncultured Desulfobacter sp. TaxID=240139 RepID=UPI0029C9AE20|nr:asparagine synthase-related protein [uncultured Desulfobacter sp.]